MLTYRPGLDRPTAKQRQPGAVSEVDRRVLAVWAADCAERAFAVFEAKAR